MDLLPHPNEEVMHLTFEKSEQTGHCEVVMFLFRHKLVAVID